MNKLPESIIIWLETKSYSQLSKFEKDIVIKILSEDEYETIHKTILVDKSYINSLNLKISDRRENIKNQWTFSSEIKTSKYFDIWKIAASVLFIVSSTLLYKNIELKKHSKIAQTTLFAKKVVLKSDTVFYTKYDTILIKSYQYNKSNIALKTCYKKNSPKSITSSVLLADNFDFIDSENESNNIRIPVSAKNFFSDSLIKSIGFHYSENESLDDIK